jgi:hypothetical protein
MRSFFFQIYYECSFFATFQDFCNVTKSNIFLIQVVNSTSNLLGKRKILIKLFNSVMSSVIVNYYAFDIYSKNSKILSIGALKLLKFNFIF